MRQRFPQFPSNRCLAEKKEKVPIGYERWPRREAQAEADDRQLAC